MEGFVFYKKIFVTVDMIISSLKKRENLPQKNIDRNLEKSLYFHSAFT